MSALAAVLLTVPTWVVWPFTLGETPNFSGVETLAAHLLRYVALLGFVQGIQMTFGFALKGAGDVRFILYVLSATSTVGFVLPIWWMVRQGFAVQRMWLWFVAQASLVAFILWRRFVGGAWRTVRMIEVDPLIRNVPEPTPSVPAD
jgi:MATE family multidrug resistance protein